MATCPEGTYEHVGDCYKNGTFDFVQVGKTDEPKTDASIATEENNLEKLFGTAENRSMYMTTSGIAFVFTLFMSVFFYRQGRSFWLWVFGLLSVYNLTHFIISAFGLHLKKR